MKRWQTQFFYRRMQEVSLGFLKSEAVNSELTSKKWCAYPTTWLCNQNILSLYCEIRVHDLINIWFWFIKCLFSTKWQLSIKVLSINPGTWSSSVIINLHHFYILCQVLQVELQKVMERSLPTPPVPLTNRWELKSEVIQSAVTFKDVQNKSPFLQQITLPSTTSSAGICWWNYVHWSLVCNTSSTCRYKLIHAMQPKQKKKRKKQAICKKCLWCIM